MYKSLASYHWRYHLLVWWQGKSPGEHAAWLYTHSAPALLLLILFVLLLRG